MMGATTPACCRFGGGVGLLGMCAAVQVAELAGGGSNSMRCNEWLGPCICKVAGRHHVQSHASYES